MQKPKGADESAAATDSSVQNTSARLSGEDDQSDAVSPSAAQSQLLRTPEKWAEFFYPVTPKGVLHDGYWKHASAAALHGWTAFEARSGAPVQLSQADYEAACAAASGNTFEAHPPADCRRKA